MDWNKDILNRTATSSMYPSTMTRTEIEHWLERIHPSVDDQTKWDIMNDPDNRLGDNTIFTLSTLNINELKDQELINIDEQDFDESGSTHRYIKLDPSTSPPIVVDSNMFIIDGYHRAAALREQGIENILAYVGDN
jgi:hypothetical protein